jgi:hypothetical protein
LATVAVLDGPGHTGQLETTGTEPFTRPVSDHIAVNRPGRGGLGHYDEVNVATGTLAVQLQLSVQDASARLRAHAFSQRQPLDEVARAIIARRLRFDDAQEPHE